MFTIFQPNATFGESSVPFNPLIVDSSPPPPTITPDMSISMKFHQHQIIRVLMYQTLKFQPPESMTSSKVGHGCQTQVVS